jgi:hypothetical protein
MLRPNEVRVSKATRCTRCVVAKQACKGGLPPPDVPLPLAGDAQDAPGPSTVRVRPRRVAKRPTITAPPLAASVSSPLPSSSAPSPSVGLGVPMDEDKFVLVAPTRKRSAAELSVASSSKHARTSRSIAGGRGGSVGSGSSSRVREEARLRPSASQPVLTAHAAGVGEGMLWDALEMSIRAQDTESALERMRYLRSWYALPR